MQVNPVGPAGNVPLPSAGPSKKDTGPDAPVAESRTGNESRARGVIRLLQEGHFKGVADVRLRINFAEEIAALQNQANARVADAGPEPILNAADAVLDDFLAQNELDPDTLEQIQSARDAFGSAIRQLFDEFSPAVDSSAQSLVDAVSAAVNEFIASIEALLPAEAPEPVVDAVPLETPGVDGEPVLDVESEIVETALEGNVLALGELVQRLREALDAAIVGLQSQFDSAQVLPPLSPASGNGRAYNRFVEILNGLYGTDTGSVDTAA